MDIQKYGLAGTAATLDDASTTRLRRAAATGGDEKETLQRAPADKENLRELFDKLEPLLGSGSLESLKLVGSLKSVPGSETLIGQIEDFYFAAAVRELAALRKE